MLISLARENSINPQWTVPTPVFFMPGLDFWSTLNGNLRCYVLLRKTWKFDKGGFQANTKNENDMQRKHAGCIPTTSNGTRLQHPTRTVYNIQQDASTTSYRIYLQYPTGCVYNTQQNMRTISNGTCLQHPMGYDYNI